MSLFPRVSLPTAVCLLALACFASAGHTATVRPTVDPSLLGGLEWRLIGPFRGGRSGAVTGVPGQPRLFYMGATGGGVWRTTDAGGSWESISDSTFGTGSVGAIGVAASDPNVIYVGMGEETVRGNVSHGDGLYRSLDAGHSWARMGLEATRQISRVRVHPTNPDLVYVAALGNLFMPTAERGVYRSKDGGRNWQRVLFVNDHTGASDLAMDPNNPRILYAGTWRVQRRPWALESGGTGSGLWKSTDAGDTWKCLTDTTNVESGLPKGTLGKVCISVSAANSDRVYAMIEAEEGGLFRSDDAGRTWTRVSSDRNLRQRAWYYTRIAADPKDPDKVWVLNVRLSVSKDGGRTFRGVGGMHGDHHDLWIDPDDSQRMINGNDGGACVSVDGGASWSSQDNQPTAQFYHVVADNSFPYRVLGSQQDNSSVSIPSRTTGYGIEREDWFDVGGGESGYIAPDPTNPEIVYAGSYDGFLTRFDRRTMQQRDINAYPDNPMGSGAEGAKERFQWTFPIVFSPHAPSTMYAASQHLFRTRDEGQTWQSISPDLTRNDASKLGPSGGPITKDNTSVEYYCTIFTVAESPKTKGVIWAGTDDGRIQLTRDDGTSWTDVTPRDLPQWSQINLIEASPHDAATAYAAIVRYKLGDLAPYAYVTHDYGRTWKRIVAGLPTNSFVRAVREDPVRKGLLYAGTETGVWVSFDDGSAWQKLQRNLPVVPVTDIAVKGDDLILATQGRAFWIMDDVTPLRALVSGAKPEMPHMFAPRATVRMAGAGVPRADAGRNPANGAMIRYQLAKALPDSIPLSLEFLDASGTVLRRFDRKGEAALDTTRKDEPQTGPKLSAKEGANTFVWDLRLAGASRFEGLINWGGGLDGPLVVPGKYSVRLKVADRVRTESFEIVKDPRLTTTVADFTEQYSLLLRIRDKLTETHDATLNIREIRDQLDGVVARAKRAGKLGAIEDSSKALKKRLVAIEETVYQTKSKSGQDPLNFPIRLNNKLALLGETVASADAKPTTVSYTVYNDLAGRIDMQLAKLKTELSEGLERFNRLVADQQVPAIVPKPAK